jgi:hypothetical protein
VGFARCLDVLGYEPMMKRDLAYRIIKSGNGTLESLCLELYGSVTDQNKNSVRRVISRIRHREGIYVAFDISRAAYVVVKKNSKIPPVDYYHRESTGTI